MTDPSVDPCQIAPGAHDDLLGPPDRHRLEAAIVVALEHLRAGGEPSAVLMIELEGLGERSEDVRGTLAGALAAALRCDDLVARFGGDVFVFVAREVADEAQAHGLASGLKRALDDAQGGGAGAHVHASVGISLMGEQDHTVAAVLARADAAMYAAKNRASRDARGHEDVRPLHSSRQALVEAAFECSAVEDFDVYYQPVADLPGGSVAALEAVLRWEHPELGTIAPGEFLPIAERHGQIVTLGRWTIEKACAQTVRWAAARDGRPMRTWVNVSAAHVADPAFVADVEAALARSGATSHQLALALPGAALASMAPDVVALFADEEIELLLRNVGMRPSPPADLAHLPIAAIKIDGSLMGRRARGGTAELLRQTAVLARRLDARAVAAGIETLEQLTMAIECGFVLAQGYLFRRPQSAPAMEELVCGERPFASLLAPRPAWLDLPLHAGGPHVEIGAPDVPLHG